MSMLDIVNIPSRDYWVKVVGMLEQNWALVETGNSQSAEVRVFSWETRAACSTR